MTKESPSVHKGLPVYEFLNSQEFEKWLENNFNHDQGFWLRFYKKASNIPGIAYTDSVDVALCYGWIDGLLNSFDEASYFIRFTPRRPKSVWSKVNVAKVEKLITEGRMKPSGLAHVNSAKSDGRWNAAYSSRKESK